MKKDIKRYLVDIIDEEYKILLKRYIIQTNEMDGDKIDENHFFKLALKRFNKERKDEGELDFKDYEVYFELNNLNDDLEVIDLTKEQTNEQK